MGVERARMITVVIDRLKWGRGFLLKPKTNKMCCLGFCALQAGLEAKFIRGKELPPESPCAGKFFNAFPLLAEPLSKKAIQVVETFGNHLYLASNQASRPYYHVLAYINDSRLSKKEREAGIVAIGALCGVKFEFVD